MLNRPDRSVVITVADIMNTDVVTVTAETPLEDVVKIFTTRGFAGIPVVSGDGTLLGVITQYDLVTKGSGIHIPTLIKTLEQVKMVRAEKFILEGTLAPVKKLMARDAMNDDPLFLHADDPIEEALRQFAEHHRVNPIIVVDKKKKVTGVLSRHDLIKILALKELGKTINAAIGRTQNPPGTEAAVAGAIRGVRKEFLFMPKYKMARWMILGIAIFIIGAASSFLFIVNLPDYNLKKPEVGRNIVVGNGATLSLRPDAARVALGEDISVDIVLATKSALVLKEAIISVEYDPTVLVVVGPAENLDAAWESTLQLIDLKNDQLILSWRLSPPQVLAAGEVFLGRLALRPFQKGKIGLIPDFRAPRESAGSTVNDVDGGNVLDAVRGMEVEIF